MRKEKESNTSKNKDLKFWDDVAKAFKEIGKDDDIQLWENEVGSFYAEVEESEKRSYNDQ